MTPPWTGQPLAVGAMRLSIDPDRDEARGIATLHAALDAGVRLIDTADVYCHDDGDIGHNERLVAAALARWEGDRSAVRVATKGGLTRPDGRWVANGRARHLEEACARSARALGVDRIFLYQLHAPDPKTPLATSVRALESLRGQGLVEHIGLSNVTAGQLAEARALAPISAVQVELSPWHDDVLRNGVAEACLDAGIPILAYRPLGGRARKGRLRGDPVLGAIAARQAVAPEVVVLAWLRALHESIVPLPGPTRPESAASLAQVAAMQLAAEDLAALEAQFPAARLLHSPRSARRPRATGTGEVVVVMGLPAAGKSTRAQALVAEGYERLNRDEAGGRLADLLPALDRHLAEGRTRVVLDNTYGTRASRNAVIETAWARGASVRCEWMQTSLEDAQVNAVLRTIERYGRLLGPDEMRKASRRDPGVFPPQVLFRHRREFEPPDVAEGFTRVDAVPFTRAWPADRDQRAVLFWYDGVLRASARGLRAPADPDDVVVLPRREAGLRRAAAEGYRLLGIAWHPEIARGTASVESVQAILARTHEQLGHALEAEICPHPEGPPVCWCRKPLPGLGVVLVERHRLDPARCVYVGKEPGDRTFARSLGMAYRDADEFFAP